uniref:BTB domain-containing protein n=1 Tax=Panagrolaimus sp. ES5 TaxID=591445 RepID=A0AC34F8F8_9BILA
MENGEKQTLLYLNIEMEKKKKIDVSYSLSINTSDFKNEMYYMLEESDGSECALCPTKDLFDPIKGYFVDGYLTINLNGIFTMDADNDFMIVVGNQEINVHKQVLMDSSSVFNGMFESGWKESIENKIFVEDFSFVIVDAAVKLCYGFDVPQNFTYEDMLSLYRFADKYEMKRIMASFNFFTKIITLIFQDLVENYLIENLSTSNVVQLIHFSKFLNASKIYQTCIDLVLKCSEKHIPVLGLESLDKEFRLMLFSKTFCSVP